MDEDTGPSTGASAGFGRPPMPGWVKAVLVVVAVVVVAVVVLLLVAPGEHGPGRHLSGAARPETASQRVSSSTGLV